MPVRAEGPQLWAQSGYPKPDRLDQIGFSKAEHQRALGGGDPQIWSKMLLVKGQKTPKLCQWRGSSRMG